jgi:hypothetical protein
MKNFRILLLVAAMGLVLLAGECTDIALFSRTSLGTAFLDK